MAKMFLKSNMPLSTCIAESCEGCELSNKVVCHFNGKQLLLFLMIPIPTFILGAIAIILTKAIWITGIAVLFVAYFGFFEIRAMCSHCPHYAEDCKSLKCWANYGAPKIWKYHPGPMKPWEKIVFAGGGIALILYPVPFFIIGNFYLLLAIYVVLVIIGAVILHTQFCNRCINFACPLNRVDEETRISFRKMNPMSWT